MAKIICITTGLTGILNASFELVKRLESEGHSVIYASPKEVGERVIQQGIPFVQLPEIKQQPAPYVPAFKGTFRKVYRLLYKLTNTKARRKEALENLIPKAFSALLDKESPDLVIIDIELHEYIFRAYSKQVPFVLLSQWFSLWKRPGLPYLLRDTIPNRTWKGSKIAIKFSWWKIKIQRWWTFSKQKWYTGHTDRRSILLDFAKQEGFPLKYIKENYWPGPFTYAELPVMSMTANEMEFPHIKRPNLTYIGPMIHEKRIDSDKKSIRGYTIKEVFEYRKKTGSSLLYCSISTLSKGDILFVKKLIEAVGKRKDWVLIIGMGGLLQEKDLEGLPENVFPFSYVAQLKVLEQADCSINHGGIHTINECIHYKVPMLVYSGKKSDQNGCAARVDYHGLGIMADKDLDRPEEIEYKIDQILKNNSFREKVGKMNHVFSEYRDHRSLEKTILNML